MKKLCFFVLALVFLCSCGIMNKPTLDQIQKADFGPFPENWKKATSEAISSELIRPEELYIRKIEEPKKTWIGTLDGQFFFGWGVCGFIVVGPQGRGQFQPFLVLLNRDEPIYKVMGFNTMIRYPGKRFNGVQGGTWDVCCPNLFKN